MSNSTKSTKVMDPIRFAIITPRKIESIKCRIDKNSKILNQYVNWVHVIPQESLIDVLPQAAYAAIFRAFK